jgi:hypothetical protein
MIVRGYLSRTPEEHQGGLLDGDEWQRAARECAAAQGQDVTRWRCDHRFKVGRRRYAVAWDGQHWIVLSDQPGAR